MKLTKEGVDYVVIEEGMIDAFDPTQKIHLIELAFERPTKELVDKVLRRYPLTNRYIITDNIQTYNSILKRTGKKYYIANTEQDELITFFRRNNKVLLDMTVLSNDELAFVCGSALSDVLANCEVIATSNEIFNTIKSALSSWRGNVIIRD